MIVLSLQVSGKPSGEVAAHCLAPAILGRCLAASLLCLVWWRLYNKIRWSGEGWRQPLRHHAMFSLIKVKVWKGHCVGPVWPLSRAVVSKFVNGVRWGSAAEMMVRVASLSAPPLGSCHAKWLPLCVFLRSRNHKAYVQMKLVKDAFLTNVFFWNYYFVWGCPKSSVPSI